jgi:DNA-binding CsgD family transcriptional regulator
MKEDINALKTYEEMTELISEFSNLKDESNHDRYAQIDELTNGFSKNDNSLKVIIDLSNFRIIAVSENLEALTGYTEKDYDSGNILMFLNSILTEHLFAPVTIFRWGVEIFKQMPLNTDFGKGKTQICGVKIRDKKGQKIRALLRFSVLELAENNYPKICYLSIDFIDHLLKPNAHWWGRIHYGEENPHKFHILGTDKKNVYQDILTNREKDVLKLVAEGLESKEISEQLFISSHTVDNHRRNAIIRTGARDTTALTQICKMCGII